MYQAEIHSPLLRCSKARRSGTGFTLVGSTTVKACKSFLSTESFLRV